jgi:hypothetical protein
VVELFQIYFLSLVDKYGQNVGSDTSSTVTLNINTTGVSTSYTPVLSGTTTVIAIKGMFNFTGITFTSEPNASFSNSIICNLF